MRETSMNVLGKRPDGELLPATPAVLGSSWTLFVEAPVLESPAGHWPAVSVTLIQATSS